MERGCAYGATTRPNRASDYTSGGAHKNGLKISFTKYMPDILLWAFISLGSAHYDLWPVVLSHVHAHEAADLIIQAELSVYTPLSLGVSHSTPSQAVGMTSETR